MPVGMSKEVLGTGGALFDLPSSADELAVGQENDYVLERSGGKQCNSEGCFCSQRLTMDQLHVLIVLSVCGRDQALTSFSAFLRVWAQAQN